MQFPWWVPSLYAVGIVLPLWLIFVFLLGRSKSSRQARRDYLLESDRCPHCQYDLRGTPGWCPECGKEFPISLRIPHPPHRIELPDLSPDARQAIRYAVIEARELQFGYIGTEHLLLGILRQGEGDGARALNDAGITIDQLRSDIRELVEPTLPTHLSQEDRYPVVTTRLHVVFLKLSESAKLSINPLDTEDLLEQLLSDPDNTASQLVAFDTEEPLHGAMDNSPWTINHILMPLTVNLPDPDFTAAIVTASNITIAPSPPDLAAQLDKLIAQRATQDFPPPTIKDAVRAMLRKGGFKPSGRNKPASEYLAQAAREGRFPRINNLVDINNLLSLESGLPISLLDADIVGPDPVIRYGTVGEKYVFNPTGQEIDLQGLICICGGPDKTPMGNPIKDSMTAKLKETTKNVIGIIYAPQNTPDLNQLVEKFAILITQFAGATSTHVGLASASGTN